MNGLQNNEVIISTSPRIGIRPPTTPFCFPRRLGGGVTLSRFLRRKGRFIDKYTKGEGRFVDMYESKKKKKKIFFFVTVVPDSIQ
jgi:hypothetical protein